MIAILPVMLLVFFGLAWIIPSMKHRGTYKRNVIVSMIVSMFLLHPILAYYAFSLFSCYDVGDQSYLLSDMEVECWMGEHSSKALGIGIPILLIWIIGAPVFAF